MRIFIFLLLLMLVGIVNAIPESPSLGIELVNDPIQLGSTAEIAFYYFPETSDIAHLTVTAINATSEMTIYDGIPNAYNGYTGVTFVPTEIGKYCITGNITFFDGKMLSASDVLEVY